MTLIISESKHVLSKKIMANKKGFLLIDLTKLQTIINANTIRKTLDELYKTKNVACNSMRLCFYMIKFDLMPQVKLYFKIWPGYIQPPALYP